jgi:hypothetical protein
MQAKTMKILDTNNPDQHLFGVKIQVNSRRAVFVAEHNELFSCETEVEAQEKANKINIYISNHPELYQRFLEERNAKVINF